MCEELCMISVSGDTIGHVLAQKHEFKYIAFKSPNTYRKKDHSDASCVTIIFLGYTAI